MTSLNPTDMKKDIFASIAIKATVAIFFYFAIGHQPHSYYQVIKFVGFLGFALLAGMYWFRKNIIEALFGAIGAIFFNPFYKVTITRATWQDIDLYISLICFAWIITDLMKLAQLSRQKRETQKLSDG